jgi:hypothetical protein
MAHGFRPEPERQAPAETSEDGAQPASEPVKADQPAAEHAEAERGTEDKGAAS